MQITRVSDAVSFDPEGHRGVSPAYLQGGEDYSGSVSIVLSRYLPGAQAQLAELAVETFYVVIEGELTMDCDGLEATLGHLDTVCMTAGSLRSVHNRTRLPASMLVVRPTSTRPDPTDGPHGGAET
jgi:mannose-6-phosphate isomerase-like protein (cupin superfamily)